MNRSIYNFGVIKVLAYVKKTKGSLYGAIWKVIQYGGILSFHERKATLGCNIVVIDSRSGIWYWRYVRDNNVIGVLSFQGKIRFPSDVTFRGQLFFFSSYKKRQKRTYLPAMVYSDTITWLCSCVKLMKCLKYPMFHYPPVSALPLLGGINLFCAFLLLIYNLFASIFLIRYFFPLTTYNY